LAADEWSAALWLLPASLVGMLVGTLLHHKLPERPFQWGVSWLLVLLGVLLVVGAGRG